MAVTYFKNQIDQVSEIQENCNGVYWKINSGTTAQGSLLFYNDEAQTGNNSLPTSREKLTRFLDHLPNGAVVHISFSPKTSRQKSQGGNNNLDAKLIFAAENAPDSQNQPQANYNAIGNAATAANDFETRLTERLSSMQREFDLQRQIDNLKRELKEAQEGDMMGNMVAGLMQNLPAILGKGQPAAVAQAPQAYQQPNPGIVNGTPTPTDVEALENIVSQLYEFEGSDTIEHLTILLKLRQQNPDLYKQALSMAKGSID